MLPVIILDRAMQATCGPKGDTPKYDFSKSMQKYHPIVAGFTNTVIIKSPAAVTELKNSKAVDMQF